VVALVDGLACDRDMLIKVGVIRDSIQILQVIQHIPFLDFIIIQFQTVSQAYSLLLAEQVVEVVATTAQV
jgi:hypothetical protein